MRPFTIEIVDGKKKQGSDKLSIWYSIIIRLCCVQDKKSNDLNYEEVMGRFKTPGERVRYTALLRAFINSLDSMISVFTTPNLGVPVPSLGISFFKFCNFIRMGDCFFQRHTITPLTKFIYGI